MFLEETIEAAFMPFMRNMALFWSISGIFAFLDYFTAKLGLITKYKRQGKFIINSGGINWKKYRRTAFVTFLNQIFVSFPISIFFYYLMYQNTAIPGWGILFLQMLGLLFVEDFLFYHFHLFLHIPWFYKNVHMIHHSWRAPVACRALYAHPFEHMLANVIPIFMAGYLVGLKWEYTEYWIAFATINTLLAHSGYNILSREHDDHHRYVNVNYGTMRLFDWLYGTRTEDYLKKQKAKRKYVSQNVYIRRTKSN